MKRLTSTRLWATLGVEVGLLAAVVLASLAVGPSALGPGELFDALLHPERPGPEADILWRIRVPRVALALGVGASLSTAGVVFQALLRNPLADPFVLGVSGGAALGGITALALGAAAGLGSGAVPPAAFAGGALTTLLLFAASGGRGRASATALLLTGVVFNAFASAAIVFLASLSGLVEGARIFLWLIGSLSASRADSVGWVAAFLLLGLAIAWLLARSLNLLTLGDESAAQLGVPVEAHRRWLLAATSLMVAAAVSVAGLVGFVGLIVPHALRLVLGPDHRLLVPASALAGAIFLVVCDTVARTLLGGRELPVGAITALCGGPLFLFLLRRQQTRLGVA
ncbi:MAG: FecCD family ABC transporter permease [Myxococcota bacterium]